MQHIIYLSSFGETTNNEVALLLSEHFKNTIVLDEPSIYHHKVLNANESLMIIINDYHQYAKQR